MQRLLESKDTYCTVWDGKQRDCSAVISFLFMISHKQTGIQKSLKKVSVEEFPIISFGLFLKALLDDASTVLHHKCLTAIS